MSRLRDTARCVPHVAKLGAGYVSYLRNRTTPRYAYRSMRKLTTLTNGRFNDAVARLRGVLQPPTQHWEGAGVLGDLEPERLASIVGSLDENGYHVFEQRLPDAWIDELVRFSLDTPAPGLPSGRDATPVEPQRFDRANPTTIRHEFDTQTLFECPAIQRLACDPTLFAVAQAYFGFAPVLDLCVMWWSAAGFDSSEDRARAAQLYHIDMDRIRFLNFNVYLTDVTTDNGPHCFVRGSHRRKPRSLLRDGRIPDTSIREHYDPADVLELTGVKGTISAVDTSGFHKGKPLQSGDRLFCQVRFADSLFGQNNPPVVLNERFDADFVERVRTDPRRFPGVRQASAPVRLAGHPG